MSPDSHGGGSNNGDRHRRRGSSSWRGSEGGWNRQQRRQRRRRVFTGNRSGIPESGQQYGHNRRSRSGSGGKGTAKVVLVAAAAASVLVFFLLPVAIPTLEYHDIRQAISIDQVPGILADPVDNEPRPDIDAQPAAPLDAQPAAPHQSPGQANGKDTPRASGGEAYLPPEAEFPLDSTEQDDSTNQLGASEDDAASLRLRMLDLINEARTASGLNPVRLGANAAAQSHANSMLESCTSGHWGTDGLKPYMRYTLAGGHQHSAENVYGLSYCVKHWENYVQIRPGDEIDQSVAVLMESPGHRDNILDPHHEFVNIGLAWDRYNMMIVQHFEYDYGSFSSVPHISTDGVLSVSFDAKNGADLRFDPTIQVWYDSPPHELTRGQVANTYCYGPGTPVVSILKPLEPGLYYTSDSYLTTYPRCPDPYDIPSNTPGPGSVEAALAAHERARASSELSDRQLTRSVPFIVADTWDATPTSLDAASDISKVLAEHGPGVYTVNVWGTVRGQDVPVAEYSIFYGMDT